jgi:hypothetical protein
MPSHRNCLTLIALIVSLSLLGQVEQQPQTSGETEVLILRSSPLHLIVFHAGSRIERKVKDQLLATQEEIQRLHDEGWQLITSNGGDSFANYVFTRKRRQ